MGAGDGPNSVCVGGGGEGADTLRAPLSGTFLQTLPGSGTNITVEAT